MNHLLPAKKVEDIVVRLHESIADAQNAMRVLDTALPPKLEGRFPNHEVFNTAATLYNLSIKLTADLYPLFYDTISIHNTVEYVKKHPTIFNEEETCSEINQLTNDYYKRTNPKNTEDLVERMKKQITEEESDLRREGFSEDEIEAKIKEKNSEIEKLYEFSDNATHYLRRIREEEKDGFENESIENSMRRCLNYAKKALGEIALSDKERQQVDHALETIETKLDTIKSCVKELDAIRADYTGEYVWYMAYGSNVHTQYLKERIGDRNLLDEKPKIMELPGVEVTFNKRGPKKPLRHTSKAHKFSYATLEPANDPRAKATVLLWKVKPEAIKHIDATEMFHGEGDPNNEYERIPVMLPQKVVGENNEQLGYIYIGSPHTIDQEGKLKPSHAYLRLIADGLKLNGELEASKRILGHPHDLKSKRDYTITGDTSGYFSSDEEMFAEQERLKMFDPDGYVHADNSNQAGVLDVEAEKLTDKDRELLHPEETKGEKSLLEYLRTQQNQQRAIQR